MKSVLALTRSSCLVDLFEDTLRSNLRREQDEPFDYPDGVMWLAAGLGSPGAAIYIDARRGGPAAAWARWSGWLTELCGSTPDVAGLTLALKSNARLMCLGIEGISPSVSRAKVYWRLEEAARLDQMGIDGFKSPAFAQFLTLCIGAREIRLTGIVLNAGISVSTGKWTDFKLDVCCCPNCLNYSTKDASQTAEAIAANFGICKPPLEEALKYGELAFYGLALDSQGTPRFNVYLKPSGRVLD
jgi:hypothetical protein